LNVWERKDEIKVIAVCEMRQGSEKKHCNENDGDEIPCPFEEIEAK